MSYGIRKDLIMDFYLFIYDPDWRGIINQKETQTKQRLFIIGSSTVYPINATYVSDILKENEYDYEVFNLADMSDIPSHRVKTIEHLISLKPDVVVYGIDFLNFEKDKVNYEKINLHDLISKNPREILTKEFSNYGINFDFKFPTSPKEKMILTAKYLIRGPEYHYNPFINYIQTNIATENEIELAAQKMQFNGIDKSSNNKELEALIKIIKKLKENEIEVIVFSSPYHYSVLEKISKEDQKFIQEKIFYILKDNGVKIEFLHDRYKQISIWKDPFHIVIHPTITIYSEDIAKIIMEGLK